MQLILAQAMRPVALGVAVGLALSAAVSRVLASLLYGVSPLDPAVFAGVALFLSAVASWPAMFRRSEPRGWTPDRAAPLLAPHLCPAHLGESGFPILL